jgi:hypothetical protein
MQRSLLDQPDALRWEYPSIQGPKPSPRFVQTASLVGDSEIVFIGGKQNEESRLDEIHILVLYHHRRRHHPFASLCLWLRSCC